MGVLDGPKLGRICSMNIRPLLHLLSSGLIALLVVTVWPDTSAAQGVPTLTLDGTAAVHLLPPGQISANGEKITLTLIVTEETGSLAHGVKFRGSCEAGFLVDSK